MSEQMGVNASHHCPYDDWYLICQAVLPKISEKYDNIFLNIILKKGVYSLF